jgi:hypothetical protein
VVVSNQWALGVTTPASIAAVDTAALLPFGGPMIVHDGVAQRKTEPAETAFQVAVGGGDETICAEHRGDGRQLFFFCEMGGDLAELFSSC